MYIHDYKPSKYKQQSKQKRQIPVSIQRTIGRWQILNGHHAPPRPKCSWYWSPFLIPIRRLKRLPRADFGPDMVAWTSKKIPCFILYTDKRGPTCKCSVHIANFISLASGQSKDDSRGGGGSLFFWNTVWINLISCKVCYLQRRCKNRHRSTFKSGQRTLVDRFNLSRHNEKTWQLRFLLLRPLDRRIQEKKKQCLDAVTCLILTFWHTYLCDFLVSYRFSYGYWSELLLVLFRRRVWSALKFVSFVHYVYYILAGDCVDTTLQHSLTTHPDWIIVQIQDSWRVFQGQGNIFIHILKYFSFYLFASSFIK